MKKSVFVRFVLMALVLCMTVGLLAACNNDKTPEESTPQATTPPSGGTQNEEAEKYLPEQKDFGNYELYLLLQSEYDPDNYEYFESLNGLNGDAISQAFYERDDFLKEHFNIAITLEKTEGTGSNRAPAKIRKAMDSDEDTYDIAFLLNGMRQNVPYGDCLDVSNVSQLNLEASYWDQDLQKSWALDDMIFALEGDYNILDELCTMGVFYNRQLYTDYSYEDTYGSPYEIVSAGDWTLDLMLEMMKDTSSSDGQLTEEDRWGALIPSYYGAHAFLVGGGYRVSQSDGETTVCNLLDTTYFNNTFDALRKIIETLHYDNREVLWDSNTSVLQTTGISEMFAANQALFIVGVLETGLKFRDMEAGYGILPMPKLVSTEEGQTDYHCFVLLGSHAPMYFPKTNVTHDHLETTAALAEAMCYYSRYVPANATMSLYDAFYEKMTVAKLCRAPEDYKMMELIYFSKAYCLDSAVEFTDIPRLSMHITYDGVLNYGYEDRYTMHVSYGTLRSNMTTLRQNAQATMDLYMNNVHQNVMQMPE